MKYTVLFLILLSLPALATESLSKSIEGLLENISASDCVFIRNGREHTAAESVDHIRRKYAHFEDEIDSIDRFIALTATRSMITGRAYQVRCGAETTDSAAWIETKMTIMMEERLQPPSPSQSTD